ncbi:hypothetical protein [Pseudoxanthomonas koreensis]|uniref:hypothetical protein n=1 Tax=Pseudoxanthomonas koreensis TaxID=266061 RepID=UPI001390DBAF|nr:hypothetical protein [Pseudoxanthomonas koreensis]KAF1690757.1 hypothetical protein CSC64_11025 [Pseudoxanthomonas koreensis]
MDPFERFAERHAKDFARIARATGGEHQREDVAQEAWLMAATVATRHGRAVDFDDPAFADLLLRHLYQALVRYTELNVRRAVRLDHGSGGGDTEDAPHWLMNRLAADGGRDPLSHLVATEDAAAAPDIDAPHPSLAGAWLVLLRGCDNRMQAVAARLLISVSPPRRCRARAEMLARFQHAIPLSPPRSAAQLGPWRRYRATRTPRQLTFDFDGPLLARLP